MAKEYEWSAALTVDSGGYSGELIAIYQGDQKLYEGAVYPEQTPMTKDTGWNRTSDLTGTGTYTYVYRDSDSGDNNASMKVEVTVRDDWQVSINGRNYMDVTVHTVITSVQRTWGGGAVNANRHLWARREAGGANYFDFIDNGSTVHDILRAAYPDERDPKIDMGTYTFTLAPGEDAKRATVYWRNTTVGYESLDIPNIYTDILGVGVHFKNILPPDYRPGTTLKSAYQYGPVSDGVWRSHNREQGACHIRDSEGGSHWKECRTINGSEGGMGNPPSILLADNVDNRWRNQKLLGQE